VEAAGAELQPALPKVAGDPAQNSRLVSTAQFYTDAATGTLPQVSWGVPGLVVSPYARQGYIDHNTYSFEAWLKIVEERFGVKSLTARDANAKDMLADFDFTQQPRQPIILSATRAGSQYPQPLQTLLH